MSSSRSGLRLARTIGGAAGLGCASRGFPWKVPPRRATRATGSTQKKVTTWALPMPDTRPRRIDIDCDRNIWFAEFQAGKIGRFYRKTQTSLERPLPGSKSGHIAMMKMRSAVGRLDPDTGKVTECLFTHAELTARNSPWMRTGICRSARPSDPAEHSE